MLIQCALSSIPSFPQIQHSNPLLVYHLFDFTMTYTLRPFQYPLLASSFNFHLRRLRKTTEFIRFILDDLIPLRSSARTGLLTQFFGVYLYSYPCTEWCFLCWPNIDRTYCNRYCTCAQLNTIRHLQTKNSLPQESITAGPIIIAAMRSQDTVLIHECKYCSSFFTSPSCETTPTYPSGLITANAPHVGSTP